MRALTRSTRYRLAPLLGLLLALPVACGEEGGSVSQTQDGGGDQTQAGSDPDCHEEQFTTPSGLGILDKNCGDGDEAVAGKTVEVHYVGTLENGEQFDSSRDRGVPFQFSLGGGQVIAGWDEGVEGMKVGGIRELTIPPELGYGEMGSPPVIPPNATLVFEIELLRVL
jgi:FKBP-type peptidyl-prolyl cis-trans isomerase FkpA